MSRRLLWRIIPIVTSTGRWEYMRVVEVSPHHVTVRDASGRVYVAGRPKG